MALCRYCGKYHDVEEWPEQFRTAFTPDCCFACYSENPDRADWGHQEEEETSAEPETPNLDDDEDPDDDAFDSQMDETDGNEDDLE